MRKRTKLLSGFALAFSMFFFEGSNLDQNLQTIRKNAQINGSEASVFKQIFDDSFVDGNENLIWNTGNGKIVTDEKYEGSASFSMDSTVTVNTEFYYLFDEPIDMKHGVGNNTEFKKKAAFEFYVKLLDTPSWYNVYFLEDRGSEFQSKPVNQRYNRCVVELSKYVDLRKQNEWQFVQIPLSALSVNGNRVNDSGSGSTPAIVDLTKIAGFGIAHMTNDTNIPSPSIYYDDFKITLNNLPDENLGCTMVQSEEFAKKVENNEIKMDYVDISQYATTAFTGGKGIGWTNQGSNNELTGFDLFGEQTFNSIRFNILDPNKTNKTAIGLRSRQITDSKLFTESVAIPLNRTCDGLYMIHNMSWDDKVVAKYTYQYDDGSEEPVEIIQGRHIFNWWKAEENDVGPIIWKGSNVEASSMGLGIKLNMFGFNNPHPEKKVKSLKAEIVSTTAACMIVAVTAADCGGKGLIMPKKKNKYNPDTSSWYAYELPDYSKIAGTALDVSYLQDRNIDANGFISEKGETFVNAKGEEVNFWGINVSGEAFFKSHEEIDLLVDNVAANGYNLVRIMDYDGDYYHPNIFGSYGGTSKVDETALDQFMYFWAKLKEKGIYIDYCMLGCRYGNTLNSLGGFTSEEMGDIGLGFKFEVYIDDRLVETTKDLVRTLLTTKNTYTGTTLASDPSLAFVEVANEHNLSDMYGVYTSSTNYEFVSEAYKDRFQKLFNSFLLNKYGSNDKLRQAWRDPSYTLTGLKAKENCESGTVEIDQAYLKAGYTNQRIGDTFEFLYTLQKGFYDKMYNWSKDTDELNLKSIVAGTTNLPSNDKNDLYINAAYDYVARHYYMSHPSTGTEFNVGTASNTISSMVESLGDNIFQYSTKGKIAGKPYLVNEANEAEPNTHTAEYNILTSAIYSLQRWSICSFTFANTSLAGDRQNMISNAFEFLDHPTRMGTAASAAILYYSNAISKNTKTYYKGINENTALDPKDQSTSTMEGSYLVSTVGTYFYKEDENGNRTYYNIDGSQIKANDPSLSEAVEHQFITSEDGTILWKNDGTRVMIDTPVVQSSVGYNSGKTIPLSDVKIAVDNDYSVVTVAGLKIDEERNIVEDNSINNAKRLLITAAGQCRNTEFTLSSDGTTIEDLGEGPILVEQITGKVTLRNKNKYDIYILNTSGQRVRKATTTTDKYGYTVLEMKTEDKAMNYEAVMTKKGEDDTSLKVYADVDEDIAEKVNEIKEYLPSITKNLYLLDDAVTRGDYVASLVNALDIKSDSTRRFSDVSSYFWGYKQLSVARGAELVDGTQIKAYTDMNKKEAYLIAYRAMKHNGYTFLEDKEAPIEASVKAQMSEEEIKAINALYSTGFIKSEDVASMGIDTVLTRRETVELFYALRHPSVNPKPTPNPGTSENPGTTENPGTSEGKPTKKGCGGNIATTASLLSAFGLLAVGLVIFYFVKEKKMI